jgi:methyl-accepting chemotaxis protein
LTDAGEKELRASTGHIGKMQDQVSALAGFITIIDDISASTNILAMNAGIEAAHAGEKGAGFSVIAAEIRKLSETTSRNARKMADIVHAISGEMKNTITLTTTACDTVSEVLREVRNLSEMLSEIARELGFLSSGAGKVTGTFSMLADVSRKVEAGSGKAADDARAIEETMSLIVRLSHDTTGLIQQVSSGLEGIKQNMGGFTRIADENSATVLALNREMEAFKTA